MMGRIYKDWDQALFLDYLRRFSLPEKKKIKEYSKGMQMKLSIAAALGHHPRLLILDEATSGLDKVADYITMIHNGQVLFSEEKDSLLEDMGVIKCSHEELEHLMELERHGQLDIVGVRQSAYQSECLVRRRQEVLERWPDWVMDRTNIEEIMLFYVRGQIRMKGLLLKDLYCLKQNRKSMAFILAIWSLVFLPQRDGGLLLISLCMMVTAMFTFTISSYDKQAKWETYALSMPLTRTSMVLEKYIISLLMLILAAAISVAVTCLAWSIRTGGMDPEFLHAMGGALLSGTAMSLIYTALSLPCSLWLGAEKGRYIPGMLGLALLIFAASYFISISIYNK